MTTIYLIRHAEAEGNLHRRIHGWDDALITENGFAGATAPPPPAATARLPRSPSALPTRNSTPFIQATVSAR